MASIELDPEQRRAAHLTRGRLKLLGGPGTSKTTTLYERAAWLVERGADPGEILFFVRDRRSAMHSRDVLVRRLGWSVAGPSVLTFHAFAWSLLTRALRRSHRRRPVSDVGYELAGLAAEPLLLTAFDQRAFVMQLLAEEDRADWPVNGDLLGSQAFVGEVRDFLLRAHERLATPATIRALAAARGRPDWVELAGFLERYTARVQDPDRFPVYPHVLVDDFEEANRAEAALLDALLAEGGEARSAVIAADPGGSVFGFRGADASCLARLDAPEARLETVHRRAQAAEVGEVPDLSDEARARLGRLHAQLETVRASIRGATLAEATETVLDASGILDELAAAATTLADAARPNLGSFLDHAESFTPLEGEASLSAFLDYPDSARAVEDLEIAQPRSDASVKLMTMHQAKGVEFDVVYVPGMARATFPNVRVTDNPATSRPSSPTRCATTPPSSRTSRATWTLSGASCATASSTRSGGSPTSLSPAPARS